MAHGRLVTSIVAILSLVLALTPLGASGDNTTTLSVEAPAEVTPGSEFIARVAVDHVDDFRGCNFDVVYDHTVITVTSVTSGEIDGQPVPVGPGAWGYIPPGDEDPGKIRVLPILPISATSGLTGAGYVAEIRFRVIGAEGTSSEINLEYARMYNFARDEIPLTRVHGAVTVAGAPADLVIATTSPLPHASLGEVYSATLAATGGTSPYTWTASGLPGGLTCSTQGVISGTPTQSGDFTVTITVTDSGAASQSKGLALRVEEVVADLAVTTTELTDGELGHAYTATLAAAGGTSPYTWDCSGLPGGLTCSAEGVISGAPAQLGDFVVTVTVTDSAAASQSRDLDLKVYPAPQIVTTDLPGGKVGDAYTATLTATGGKAPYSWTAAGLPPGLACSADGVISGTPIGAVGDFTVTVSLTTAPGNTLSKSLNLIISCRPGDVNMDGFVDTADIDRVRDIFFGTAPSTACADVNGDGKVDAGDITAIRRIYYGVDSPP